jgi:acetolactate synthase-1/2/3 large subunit
MEALTREGVETIFGYPGGVVLPLYDEMLNWPQVRHVLVRHEQCAAHMAEGYARVTGEVGVCLATSGPGATNLVTGIANAMLDSIPMVAITGQVASPVIGKDAFQEVDIQGITIPITKHNYLVTNVDELPHVLTEAFHLARTGRQGPVLVDIPKDVFTATTEVDFPASIDRRGYLVHTEPDMNQIEEAAAIIESAQRPVIIAGAGVLHSGAWDELLAFAEKADIPVANSLLGIGAIPRNHELSIGMVGMHGEAAATLAVQEADVLLGIGIRFDDRLTGKTSGFAAKAKVVHFDIDPAEVDKTIHAVCFVCGDIKHSLEALIPKLKTKKHTEWRHHIRTMQVRYPLIVPDDDRFVARHVIQALNDITDGNAIVATDVGQHQMWSAQFYRSNKPRRWLSSGGLGTMGFGFPAAIGAAFAKPQDEVWAIVGDGGFQMTLQELQTAAENNVNVKIALINNGFLGMVRQWQELFYDNRYSHVAMTSPNYGKLAEAYGVRYLQCKTKEDLQETLISARGYDGPVLCEFVVEMEENVFPMVGPGAVNDAVIMDPGLEELRVSHAVVTPAKSEVKV